ncbi:MAG: YciI family protein [Solirubrobacteraceae bacterium]
MNYALLIYISPEQMQALSPEETRSLHGDHEATASTSPQVIAHYRLRPPQQTTTVRRNGDTIGRIEGASSETSEGLRALYLLESNDPDAVLDFASQHPAIAVGGTAEVWPLIAPGRRDREPHDHAGPTGRH